MLRHPHYTRARLANTAERLRGLIYPDVRAVDQLRISPRVERIPYSEARRLQYSPVALGQQLGPPWSTYWVDVIASIPGEWGGRRVDLTWVSHSEATLWVDGRSVQGLNSGSLGGRVHAVLTRSAVPHSRLNFQIEVACNGMFGGFDEPIEGSGRPYASLEPVVLDQCDVALFDPDAWTLYHDFEVLRQLEAEHSAEVDPSLAGLLLSELNRFCNIWSAEERDSWDDARRVLSELYENTNGRHSHEVVAMGHAHLDSAWLWPVAETYRKCVRTFSTQVGLMDEYPDYRFVCSQAQQLTWVKERNPDLYARIRERVSRGQFIPVGGTWIEPDCNIPSGESLVRQFLLGQAFFQEEFGQRCREFWNPDVFGYNGQLPQIMRGAGIDWFLTQKLSWNAFNKPEYHTFRWQGIDGTQVLAHFPPSDTYNSSASVSELRRSNLAYKDHDQSSISCVLFGYGDGGGGPTPEMLETLARVKDLQGVPRTTQRSSAEFFERLSENAKDLPVLVGELYFEYHRGTYTTQASVKHSNRQCEFLLRDSELLAAVAHWRGRAEYPREDLTRLWQLLCLNQFHDIITGASIAEVYVDAKRDYADVRDRGEVLRAAALGALGNEQSEHLPLNTLGTSRREVVATAEGEEALVETPPFGTGRRVPAQRPVSLEPSSAGWVLENEHLGAAINHDGSLTAVLHKQSQRAVLSGTANVLELYDDVPVAHEAWDVDPFHLETRQLCAPAYAARVAQATPLRAELYFEHRIGRQSTGTQIIRLDADSRRLEFRWTIDWREARKLLKVCFPVNVHSDSATYEMQFGVARRPTHYTTRHDLAKFEVPGHKWADLSEHGFGVSLLTDCKYGYSTFANEMRISLLRASKYPDALADIGQHNFRYALYPHSGGWQDGGVVAQALAFNVPLLWSRTRIESLFELDTSNLVLDTVKLAERENALVLRLYEAHGGRGRARLRVGVAASRVARANLLEDELDGEVVLNDQVVEIDYRPYEIVTLLVRK